MSRPARRALGALALAVLLTNAGCGGPGTEEFCDAVEATSAAGPLFPDRTDGEPVPDPEALAALEEMADTAPDDVDDELEVLVAEARALVAEAESRATRSNEEPQDTAAERPTRAEVTAAQQVVVADVAERCEIDLGA